jgi:hypothetical protein
MAFYPVAPLPDLHARQPVVTIRQPSTALFTVDSEDRFKRPNEAAAAALLPPTQTNVTPYDFTISKNESLMNGFFTRVGITEVNFPWAVPNINVKTNLIIVNWLNTVTDASGSYTVDFPEGFVRPAEIAANLQDIIQAAVSDLSAATVTWTSGSSEPYFVYATNAVGIQMSFSPMPYNSQYYPWPDTTRQLFHLMGFTDLNKILGTAGKSGWTFCQFTRYVDIVCYQMTNNQALKDQTSQAVARDMLCRLYLGDANIPGNITASFLDLSANAMFCPPGCAPFTIYRDFASPKQIQWIPNQPIPGFLRFEVFDDTGAPLNEIVAKAVAGGAPNPLDDAAAYLDWSMTMQVSEC